MNFVFAFFFVNRGLVPFFEIDHLECMSDAEGQIVLEGHTDERGTTRYNLSLGQRRAESVKRLLVGKGLSPNRMRSVSYGEERPAESGSNEASWSKNRRVEVKLVTQ